MFLVATTSSINNIKPTWVPYSSQMCLRVSQSNVWIAVVSRSFMSLIFAGNGGTLSLTHRRKNKSHTYFFLWGYVKDKVYVPPLPANISDMKDTKKQLQSTWFTATSQHTFGRDCHIGCRRWLHWAPVKLEIKTLFHVQHVSKLELSIVFHVLNIVSPSVHKTWLRNGACRRITNHTSTTNYISANLIFFHSTPESHWHSLPVLHPL